MLGRERSLHRGQGGAAAVEFALVLPVLLLLVFGIVQYGLYFWAMQGGSDIARDAARRAAVGQPASCAAFKSGVSGDVDALVGKAPAVIRRTYVKTDPTRPTITVGDEVTVRIEFTSFDLRLPFLPFIADGRVTSEASARVDFVPQQPEVCP
ncbi:TadE/TadG family type IV pilus assembly protein [Nocardioides ferulae]|uniref:TadE/TadG family type IV pilus assembly protein n=1 Tax=Nocardioides ferulae TaxID=2340821 RepID=UPI000EB1EC70|nr:TadE/TadG family type IV pilus assembly protein [Nocardioides ferulae]